MAKVRDITTFRDENIDAVLNMVVTMEHMNEVHAKLNDEIFFNYLKEKQRRFQETLEYEEIN